MLFCVSDAPVRALRVFGFQDGGYEKSMSESLRTAHHTASWLAGSWRCGGARARQLPL